MKLLALSLIAIASVAAFGNAPPPPDQAKATKHERAGTYFHSVQHLRR